MECNQCHKSCFASFIEEDNFVLVNKSKTIVEYSPGQIITKESSFDNEILFIYSGLVKIVKEGKNNKNTIVKMVGKNNFLTVPLHEEQKKFSFTAIAVTDVRICEIKEVMVHNLFSGNQKFIGRLMDKYYEDQLFLMNKLHLLSTKNNHGKLASSMLYLNQYNDDKFSIFEYISRKDLAELSSISLESVNKILQELSNDKIIAIDKKGIQINKISLLEKLSSLG